MLRAFAGIAVVGGGLLVALSFAGQPGGHDLTAFRWLGLPPLILGGAALLARKTTAVLFSLISVSFAGLFLMPCFTTPPHPGMVFPILIAVLCCLPVLFTIRGWEALR